MMKLKALLVLTVGFLIAADANEEKAAKKELKRLEGTYVLVSGEDKGEKFPEKIIKDAALTIEGDKHTVKLGEVMIVGTHKVDPSKKPKEIDGMDTEGPNKGKTTLGIYKLEKGEFTVCFAPPEKARPTEFTTKSGTGVFVHVWKREKK